MLGWSVLSDIFKPQYWFTWLWTGNNGQSDTAIDKSGDAYLVTKDTCVKCNRFLSYHSKNNSHCSFHNVTWTNDKAADKRKSYELFKNSFEMWLRSRCGGDIDEGRINTNLLTLSSYLDYAATHSQTNGNLYDFCDLSFCDYQMVYDFLIDLRLQAQERHTVDTELRICEAMKRFIEFRKFQLPIKGIVENRYSASERVLETYRRLLLQNQRATVDLMSTIITYNDVQLTVNHFQPQYDIIIDYLHQWQNVRTMENGCDIEFATSFLCTYLYSIMPQHIPVLHLVRVRDLCLEPNSSVTYDERKYLHTELSQFVSRSCEDLPSPVIASACISKLQKCLTLDEKTKAIVSSYVTYIRPRITKSNDYLLLNSSALGLTSDQVQERIITLVYRVTGKVTDLVDKFEEDVPSTPLAPPQSKRSKAVSRASTTQLKKVRFNCIVSKKLVNKYTKNKLKRKRNLLLDLTNISVA